MKQLRRWTALVMTLVTLCPTVRSETPSRVTVPAGTPVILKLVTPISSATQKKGDTVSMEVAADVFVNGVVVVKAGTPVPAVVEDAARRFFAGIGGYIKLSVQSVSSTGGTMIPLKFEKSSSGETSLLGAILGVVCCCVFLLIPGKDVSMPAGTLYNAVVLGPTDAEVRAAPSKG